MPLAKTEYSEAETKMFYALGCGSLLPHLLPAAMYRIAVEECFIYDRVGLAVDSLRRTAKAFSVCNPSRMTPEFDKLIILQ